MRKVSGTPQLTAEKASEVGATAEAVESPQAAVREEDYKEARDTVQDLAEFSWEEEVEAAEALAAAVEAEEVLDQAAEAAAVSAWAEGADPLWTFLRSFGPPPRRRLRRPCRALQPSPQRQWRHVRRQTTGDEASPPSCKRTSATSAASKGKSTSPPSG